MIAVTDLKQIARARLRDASVLMTHGRGDGAVYLCGYAVEIALKVRICQTLQWTDFPDTDSNYQSFKTHNLDRLLHLSGREDALVTRFFAEWSLLKNNWSPEMRYKLPGGVSPAVAAATVAAARVLVKFLMS